MALNEFLRTIIERLKALMLQPSLFSEDDRVRVIRPIGSDFSGATGKIVQYPGLDSLARTVHLSNGRTHIFYWVIFDSYQFASDKDGPYSASEITAEELQRI